MAPETPEERIVWYAMLGTWGFWLLGALYIVAPVIAWILFAMGLRTLCLELVRGGSFRRFGISWSVLAWFAGMAMMLVALVIGHANHGIGLGATIKSSIGWAKGWALMALFPFIGCLAIRPALVIRAACTVGKHTLIAIPVLVAWWLAGLPQILWVSPLQAVGGPGPEFFSVMLYEIDPGSGWPRWRMFAPWAPALGFVGNLYFLFALHEPDRRWRLYGLLGSVSMILMSGSRLAIVALATVAIATWVISRASRPAMLYAGGLGCAALGLLAAPLLRALDAVATGFREARADSSRVRSALGRIAVERWRSEAPVWGHGVVERGPHLVEYMPIGSHHSWLGLLFVKGAVGFAALALPMLASASELALKSGRSDAARVGLGVLLTLFLYTFGENLEILAYLVWPGLLFLGMGTRPSGAADPRECGAGPVPAARDGARWIDVDLGASPDAGGTRPVGADAFAGRAPEALLDVVL